MQMCPGPCVQKPAVPNPQHFPARFGSRGLSLASGVSPDDDRVGNRQGVDGSYQDVDYRDACRCG